MAEAERIVETSAPAEVLFDVITDYAAYPEFVPGLDAVEVLSRSETRAEVRFRLRLVRSISYTLELVEERPRSVVWTMVSGDLATNSGSWTVTSTDTGSLATYKVRVEVGMFVPGAILGRLVGETLPATLDAFARRAEARTLESPR